MNTREIESKVRELRQLQALIDEAQAEAEAIKDTIKAANTLLLCMFRLLHITKTETAQILHEHRSGIALRPRC